MHCMHKFGSTARSYKGLECLEVCSYDRKFIFRDFFFPYNFLITEVLERSYLSYFFLQTNFTQFQLLFFIFFYFQQQLLLCRRFIICASPFGLFLHTAVWVTHQKQDSRSSSQKETRKGLQHIEPINSTPLALLTFGGVSQRCN